jgi:hypothetical protein
MASNLEDRSTEENQRNIERFTPLMYQLKRSGPSVSQNHSQKQDIIGQEPGAYPYPSGDGRISSNNLGETDNQTLNPYHTVKYLS